MRTLTTSLCMLLFLCGICQDMDAPLKLPRDNNRAVSFCSSFDVDGDIDGKFHSACTSALTLPYMTVLSLSDRHMMAMMKVDVADRTITGRLTMDQKRGHLSYSVQDYRVDDILLDEWLGSASNASAAEQVKSAIFSRTVLVISEMKAAIAGQ